MRLFQQPVNSRQAKGRARGPCRSLPRRGPQSGGHAGGGPPCGRPCRGCNAPSPPSPPTFIPNSTSRPPTRSTPGSRGLWKGNRRRAQRGPASPCPLNRPERRKAVPEAGAACHLSSLTHHSLPGNPQTSPLPRRSGVSQLPQKRWRQDRSVARFLHRRACCRPGHPPPDPRRGPLPNLFP